jgi:hypothetical protein
MAGTFPPPPPVPVHPPSATATLPTRTNDMAIASLCCALGSFVTGVTSILGIVFGHIALRQIKRDPTQGGSSMAIAGIVIGYIVLAMVVFLIVTLLSLDD